MLAGPSALRSSTSISGLALSKHSFDGTRGTSVHSNSTSPIPERNLRPSRRIVIRIRPLPSQSFYFGGHVHVPVAHLRLQNYLPPGAAQVSFVSNAYKASIPQSNGPLFSNS